MKNRMARYFGPQSYAPAYGSQAQTPFFSGEIGFGLSPLFEEILNGFMQSSPSYKAETITTGDQGEIILSIELPGYTINQLEVIADKGILSLAGNREDRKFKRSYSLPDNALVEEITATLKDGILTITIPREEGEIRKIPIN